MPRLTAGLSPAVTAADSGRPEAASDRGLRQQVQLRLDVKNIQHVLLKPVPILSTGAKAVVMNSLYLSAGFSAAPRQKNPPSRSF